MQTKEKAVVPMTQPIIVARVWKRKQKRNPRKNKTANKTVSNKQIILCFFNTEIFSKSSNRFIHSIVIFDGKHVHGRERSSLSFSLEALTIQEILCYISKQETVFLDEVSPL